MSTSLPSSSNPANWGSLLRAASYDIALFIVGAAIGLMIDTVFIRITQTISGVAELEWIVTFLGLAQLFVNALLIHIADIGLTSTGFLLMGMLSPQTLIINQFYSLPQAKRIKASQNIKEVLPNDPNT